MPMINAVGTSLMAVSTFGLTTASNYAFSGLVDWAIASEFIAGGVVGGFFGMLFSSRLARGRSILNRIFSGVVLTVAIYILSQTI